LEKLNKKIHSQPEGIVFGKDGTLYISNEGKKEGNGTVSIFREI
jgi:DNA-binding beta-propeller fold protein YncE